MCKGAAKAAKPSWSPNPGRAGIQFGFQEQFTPESSPRSHTNSILDVLYMDGKLRGSNFQWSQSHIQIPSESTGNVKTMRRTESITVLCYHILAPWAMYQVRPNRAHPRVRARPSPCPGRPLPLSYTPLATRNRGGFVD
jgi:hypothetical protein